MRQFGARLFEAGPGLVTWVLLLAPAWIPIIFHSSGALFVAVVVLIFDTYWVVRAVSVVTGVYSTMLRMRRDMKKDWLAMCRQQPPAGGVDPLQYLHLSVVPTYTEPYHVLERTVQAIVDANYPDELKLVGIITRETDKPGWENVARLKEKFGHRLRGFYHIKDPLEPGIVVGKSAAMNWGGRWMVRVLTEEGFDLSKVLITDLDSDYRVHPQYFGWISWHHAREPLRDFVIWQPVPLFHNNIWQVPMAVRIMSASTSQWQMFLHSRPNRPVHEPLPEPPQLDLSAGPPVIRFLGSDLGQRGLLADRPWSGAVERVGRPAWDHSFHRAFLSLLRDPDPAAQTGWLAKVEEGRDLLPVLPLSDRRSDPQRPSGTGGPHPITVWALPRVPGDGEGVRIGRRKRADGGEDSCRPLPAGPRQAARTGPRPGPRDAELETAAESQLDRRARRAFSRVGDRDDPRFADDPHRPGPRRGVQGRGRRSGPACAARPGRPKPGGASRRADP